MKKNCLFIFVDESGNFDFSHKGTKYFILTSITTLNPQGKEKLEEIKYNFLRKGLDIEYFHATEDKQTVRDKIFEFIENLNDIEIDSVVVQKNKTNPSLYEDKRHKKIRHKGEQLYEIALKTLLQYIFSKYKSRTNIEQVIVLLSSIFTRNKEKLISKTIKAYLKQNFLWLSRIYFHNSKSDKNSQISDYCCWAIYKKWEDKELRPYKMIRNKIRSEFNIFERGETTYYEYEK